MMEPTEAIEIIPQSKIDLLSELSQDQRVEVIDDAIHRLNFERRFTLLTEDQIQHMECELSTDARKALDKVKGTPSFDKKIEEFARSHYMRQCAWVNYLNNGGDAPNPSQRIRRRQGGGMSVNLRTNWQGTRTEGGTLQYTHPAYPFKISLGASGYGVMTQQASGRKTRITKTQLHDLLSQLQDLADAGQITTKETTT